MVENDFDSGFGSLFFSCYSFAGPTAYNQQISRLESIENPGPEDRDSLNVLKSYLKGGTSERKGTLQNYISRVQTERNPH
jgi:hypothetical protein